MDAALFITPVVKDMQGRKLRRTMRRTDKLEDLMRFYYSLVPEANDGQGVFLHRGRWIKGGETPEDCKMKDHDEIDFFPSMYVTPVVEDEEGRRFTRTMRRIDRMQDLMDYYYAMMPSAENGRGVFVLADHYRRVMGDKTPAELELEDGDEILFMMRS